MNKFDEALEKLEYSDEIGHIPPHVYCDIKYALKQAQKQEQEHIEYSKKVQEQFSNDTKRIGELESKLIRQEELLKELKDIFNKHSIRLDRMREWYNLQTLESRVLTDIEKLIKEIENETK